jgi:hypothetical protein
VRIRSRCGGVNEDSSRSTYAKRLSKDPLLESASQADDKTRRDVTQGRNKLVAWEPHATSIHSMLHGHRRPHEPSKNRVIVATKVVIAENR